MNLGQASIGSKEQQGGDLLIRLSDGRSVVLSGYFDEAAGDVNRLFLSTNGNIPEVMAPESGDGDPHDKVTLRVDRAALKGRQSGLEIRPGMPAEVELQTGGKTILTYLTKPLHKSGEALRER